MKTIKIFETLKESFQSFKLNIWFLVSTTFVYYAIYFVLTRSGKGPGSVILYVGAMVVSMLFSIGMYKIGLNTYSKQKLSYEVFKSVSPQFFFSFLWMSILVGVFVFLGFILLVIPGIIVMVRLSMSYFVMTEKNMNAMDSMKESWRLTKGSSLKILGFMIIFWILFVFALIPFGLGLLLATPYYYIAGALLYKKLENKNKEVVSTTPSTESQTN